MYIKRGWFCKVLCLSHYLLLLTPQTGFIGSMPHHLYYSEAEQPRCSSEASHVTHSPVPDPYWGHQFHARQVMYVVWGLQTLMRVLEALLREFSLLMRHLNLNGQLWTHRVQSESPRQSVCTGILPGRTIKTALQTKSKWARGKKCIFMYWCHV